MSDWLGRVCVIAGSCWLPSLGPSFPDLDMLYFYLIDGRQTHHHDYITHWPLLYWASLGVALAARSSDTRWSTLGVTFSLAALVHMVLDSIAAPIKWLAPFSERAVELVSVPATHPNWVVSFVTHWTFALELSICAVAAFLLYARRTAN